jgi:coatomer subunit beta'
LDINLLSSDFFTGASSILVWRKCHEVIKRICEGLYHLHMKQRNVHLNLKPANILLDDNMVPKIANFGLHLKSDIYSLGVIIIKILSGEKGYRYVEEQQPI